MIERIWISILCYLDVYAQIAQSRCVVCGILLMLIFSEKEGRQLEFKEYLNNHRRLCETVVAFSNDIGGRILLGVRDTDRAIIGVPEDKIDAIIETLPQVIYDTVTPYCRPFIQTLNFEGVNVIEIRVSAGDRKPYFIKNKGIPEGVYFRIGSHNRKATPELLEDLQRQTQGKHFDLELVVGSSYEDFDKTVLEEIYSAKTGNEQKLLGDHAVRIEPVSGSLLPTISGHVYFHKEPDKQLPQAEILLTHFGAKDHSEIIKTIDLAGPLPVLASRVMGIVLEWVGGGPLVLDGARKIPKEYDIPKEALREAIVNALIHRKYFIPDAVKIAVYVDRVEIYSPGNFPGLIGDLKNGMSYPRNPHLRQLARKHNLVEKRGLGLNLIFDSCQKNGNPDPEILELDDAVKVILYRGRHQKKKDLPEYAKDLNEFYHLGKNISITEASQALEVSPNTARKTLLRLQEDGFLFVKGKGRATKYCWH